MNAAELALQFSELQQQLVGALIHSLPMVSNWNTLLDVPKTGLVQACGEEWAYKRHGAGVLFSGRASRRIVDAHVFLKRFPEAIDGWRLAEYAESIGVSQLQHGGLTYAIENEHEIDACLSILAREGILRAEENGRIWIPDFTPRLV